MKGWERSGSIAHVLCMNKWLRLTAAAVVDGSGGAVVVIAVP
jgi:hypothetical protein